MLADKEVSAMSWQAGMPPMSGGLSLSGLETVIWQGRELFLSAFHSNGLTFDIVFIFGVKIKGRYNAVGDLPGQAYKDSERP